MNNKLLQRIKNNEEIVGILGLGYVGLPLAVTFALKNVNVLGFEKNKIKAEKVNKAENYIGDVDDEVLKTVIANKKLSATDDFSRIAECDAVIICVPTPLDKFKKPDMSYIESACQEIGRHMKKGTFISLESTTYPTTTENLMLPILEKASGMVHGEDFWLAFSPERVDPGNTDYKTDNTPKVFGAMTEEGREIGMAIYSKAIKHLYPVSSPRVAEMVKILENTYRLVNISLVNELALLAGKMNIDIWEVIEAAKTKPYGFQAFYPGPGIGGHCIPLDPFYLEYIAKNYNFDLSMIHTAGNINTIMPHRMVVKIGFALNKHSKPIKGSKLLFLGVAYKPNISDERESPVLRIIDELIHKGGDVEYHDPFVQKIITPNEIEMNSVSDFESNLKGYDCIIIGTKHSNFDYELIGRNAKLIVDLQNAFNKENEKIFKL